MRLRIQLPDGRVKNWTAKTRRGFNKRQLREIAEFRKLAKGKDR